MTLIDWFAMPLVLLTGICLVTAILTSNVAIEIKSVLSQVKKEGVFNKWNSLNRGQKKFIVVASYGVTPLVPLASFSPFWLMKQQPPTSITFNQCLLIQFTILSIFLIVLLVGSKLKVKNN
jgi:hypothetical protein